MEIPTKRQREENLKLKMDSKGRLVDEQGKVIEMPVSHKFSLEINKLRHEKKKKKNQYFQNTKSSLMPRGYFFDQNLPKKKQKSKSLTFTFNDTSQKIQLIANVTPSIEWWDKDLVQSYSDHYNPEKITADITSPILPTNKPINSTSHLATMHLTPKEKKKIKRLKKAQKLKEIREKVKIGLLEPPPQKIKLGSLMKLMSKELAQDPSKTEQEILNKYNERLKKHITRNEEHKLTHAQRVERSLRKLRRDSAREMRTAVFQVSHFSSTKIKFKVMKNAQQLALVGVCFVLPKPLMGMIVVEGGKKAIKFFKRLCLNRIDWQSDGSSCNLVWDSEIKEARFFKFKILNVDSEIDVKRILDKKNAMNYWDIVSNWKPPSDLL